MAALTAGERHIGQLTRRSETLEGWLIEPTFGQPYVTQHAGFEARAVSELPEVGLVADNLDQSAGGPGARRLPPRPSGRAVKRSSTHNSAPTPATQLNIRQQHGAVSAKAHVTSGRTAFFGPAPLSSRERAWSMCAGSRPTARRASDSA